MITICFVKFIDASACLMLQLTISFVAVRLQAPEKKILKDTHDPILMIVHNLLCHGSHVSCLLFGNSLKYLFTVLLFISHANQLTTS